MTRPTADPDARDAITLILPGAVGIGIGAFAGALLSESLLVLGAVALLGGIAGHTVGYLLVRERSDRFG